MERRGEDFRGFWRIEEDLQRILEEGACLLQCLAFASDLPCSFAEGDDGLAKGDGGFAKGDDGLAEGDDCAIAVGLGVNGDRLAAFGFILDVA